jgi:hypothetical protein
MVLEAMLDLWEQFLYKGEGPKIQIESFLKILRA